MRIQDMRSGISHLSKRMESERRQNAFGTAAAPGLAPEPRVEPVPELPDLPPALMQVASDLEAPVWSVVSFDKQEAGGLTYRQAAALVAELDGCGIHGLCVITDDAAKRYGA